LKLSGGTTELALKTGAPLDNLQMKLSGGANGLPLKMGDIAAGEGYGIKNLPGIYTNGEATGDATTGGLKLKLGDSTAETSPTPTPAPGMGIAGLPGLDLPDNIDLNHVTPQQAPQVADVAIGVNDPQQRGAMEDIALQAAEKDPELNKPSDDPLVQDYQDSKRVYDGAKDANTAALQQASEAQGRAQADQTALTYAKQQMEASPASEQVKQAYAQMQALAGTDEEVAVKAREMFEGTQIQLSVNRDEATVSLAGLSLPSASGVSATNTAAAPAHDAPPKNPISVSAGTHPVGRPGLDPSATPRILATPPPGGRPVAETMQACMARLNPNGDVPSLEDLQKKMESTAKALERIAKSQETANGEAEDWRKVYKDGYEDMSIGGGGPAVGWAAGRQQRRL
jgi:hypothetical protein